MITMTKKQDSQNSQFDILGDLARCMVTLCGPLFSPHLLFLVYLADRAAVSKTGSPISFDGFSYFSNPMLDNPVTQSDGWLKNIALNKNGLCIPAHDGEFLELSESSVNLVSHIANAYGTLAFDHLCRGFKGVYPELDFDAREPQIIKLKDLLTGIGFNDKTVLSLMQQYNDHLGLKKVTDQLR